MNTELVSFKKDKDFYGKLDLTLTVKSFDLQAIRKRYLASKQNKSGRSGSVERRAVALGGLVSCSIEKGACHIKETFKDIPEPRGIARSSSYFAFSAEKEVHVIESDGTAKILSDPWFSYIHTIDFNSSETRVVVSSSGFDLIQEWDIQLASKKREWLAWENGFNKAIHPETKEVITLTRDVTKKGVNNYHVVSNPELEVLPTAMRAAFINSVTYKNEDEVLATFFHEGAVFKINLNSGKTEKLIGGMKNPHGGRLFKHGYLATSTGTGVLHTLEGNTEQTFSLTQLPGKPDFLAEMEWVQNALTHENLIIAIDSNRTSFVVIDLKEKLYDLIPYDHNWAIQDGVVGTLNEKRTAYLRNLSQESNE